MSGQPMARPPRFAIGAEVRIDTREAVGHCRSPWYLRGHVGHVVGIQGCYRDPERLAYHRPGLPARVLYKVRFSQRDLWTDYQGDTIDQLEADIYEHWLTPATEQADA